MNKKEKTLILEVIERVTRVEERIVSGFQRQKEITEEIREHVRKTNEEVGDLERRISSVENLYHEAKTSWEKSKTLWAFTSIVVSPIVTFLIICLAKLILGLPIP